MIIPPKFLHEKGPTWKEIGVSTKILCGGNAPRRAASRSANSLRTSPFDRRDRSRTGLVFPGAGQVNHLCSGPLQKVLEGPVWKVLEGQDLEGPMGLHMS